MTPAEKAIEFLNKTDVQSMSAYISARLYHMLESVTKHKTIFEIITNYNSYRNSRYTNFGQRSIHELVAALFNLYGIIVPMQYHYAGGKQIVITSENVLDFFSDKKKFSDEKN